MNISARIRRLEALAGARTAEPPLPHRPWTEQQEREFQTLWADMLERHPPSIYTLKEFNASLAELEKHP